MDRPIIQKHKTLKRVLAFVGVPLVFIAIGYFSFREAGTKKLTIERDKLTISEVKTEQFKEYIPVEGVVHPIRSIYMDAIEGGMVEQVFKEDGAMVQKDEPILKLSNTNLQLDIMQREATLFELMDRLQTTKLNYEKNRTGLLMQLSDLEYQLTDAERVHEVNIGLYADKVISKKEFNEAENKYLYLKSKLALTQRMLKQDSLSAQEQIRQMKSSISRMDKNMEVMKTKVDNLIVKAPATGQLTSLSVEVGELKSQGKNLGQIDVMTAFKIKATIDEYYINRIYSGQKAALALAGKEYRLTIRKIYPNVKSGKFVVDLAFSEEEIDDLLLSKLRRGQTFSLRLEMSDEKKAMVITRGSFYNTTGGNWIFVLNKEGDKAF